MEEHKTATQTRLLEVLSQMRAHDENFAKMVEEIGLTRGFHDGLTVRSPKSMHEPFLINQALFRQIFVMRDGTAPLKLCKYTPFVVDFEKPHLKVQVGDKTSLDYFISCLVARGYKRSFCATRSWNFQRDWR
ncbi:MAG: hypothetical protein LBP35_05940 [Candidatus Ancillula trichonymphae]|jgi:hypothetical protein|nr:hypothetical protein [Candidatus Ancillula trichonymphae]